MIGKARVASSKIQDGCRSFRRPVRIGYGDAHHVYTVERVAGDLGVSEELIQELPHDLALAPEHGVIRV
ncbi:hypothetical protein RFM26_05070 [Mesorhizobium sp. VK23B]|uniref:Uncharacterized protein n=1 Tax=Mesorhizobium dulcispinae TaxID=3072316 RepID=A0ABU4XFC5_9HYPH|nr:MULTISPECIES: hypothetical protein [unclassified Mesorhizobium]MDX8465050.1 hypothetical protein [Mesorhizobium sp. VK23B]MDX8472733.1 hypothetical protein [Mesorhizobium sp. VK23A]MDX8518315.1 hypothetical protein [Mesorhizobium sp. VK23D]